MGFHIGQDEYGVYFRVIQQCVFRRIGFAAVKGGFGFAFGSSAVPKSLQLDSGQLPDSVGMQVCNVARAEKSYF
jgi:hypothetical protein